MYETYKDSKVPVKIRATVRGEEILKTIFLRKLHKKDKLDYLSKKLSFVLLKNIKNVV